MGKYLKPLRARRSPSGPLSGPGGRAARRRYSELYTALQQGVCDGEENPLQNLVVDKLAEVQKYCSMTNHLYQMSAQVISQKFWDSLSAEDQELFERLIAEAEQAGFARVEELTEYYKEECQNSGMAIRVLTEEELSVFKTLMEEKVYPKAAESMGQERWEKLLSYTAE